MFFVSALEPVLQYCNSSTTTHVANTRLVEQRVLLFIRGHADASRGTVYLRRSDEDEVGLRLRLMELLACFLQIFLRFRHASAVSADGRSAKVTAEHWIACAFDKYFESLRESGRAMNGNTRPLPG